MKIYPNDPQAFMKFQSQAQLVALGDSLRMATQRVEYVEDGTGGVDRRTMLLLDMNTTEGRVCYQVEAEAFLFALTSALGEGIEHVRALADAADGSAGSVGDDADALPEDIVADLEHGLADEADSSL